MDMVVVDIGEREVPGLSYMALSRVRHISGLAVRGFPFDRLQKIGSSNFRSSERRCYTPK